MIARCFVLFVAILLGAVPSMADRAAAQSYPDRLIRMVVPYPAGGPITSPRGWWRSASARSWGRLSS